MGQSKYEYMIGQVMAEDWLVTGKDKWDKYECECIHCGKTRKFRGGALDNGTARRCQCQVPVTGFIDMTNMNFGEWHVDSYAGGGAWNCTCSCGTKKTIPGCDLREGATTSCGHKESLVGEVFNEWEVIGDGEKSGYVLCRCSCGHIAEVHTYNLRAGISKSCGHDTTKLKDLTGMQFNEWYVVRRLDGKGNYECRCSCGNIKTVHGYALRSGTSKSCGHKANEFRKETCKITYGVPFAAQRNSSRTAEQIEITLGDNNVVRIIEDIEKEKGGKKPTIFDFCKVTGMDRGSAHAFLRRRNLLDRFSINSNASHYEDELNELFPGAVKRARILDGAEIDLYYPDYKFGIEFNGNHWHNESKRDKNYHKDKSLKAYKKGIDIFHIFEYEWNDPLKHDKIIQEINRRVQAKSIKNIDIEKCSLVDVDGDICNKFFKKYSLIDDPDNTCGIAIYLENKVIGILGFKKLNSAEYQWEMPGIAFADGYNIKDVRAPFQQFVQEHDVDNIIIYYDFSRGSGRVYKSLGFIRRNVSEPSFVRYDEYLQDAIYPKMNNENDPKCEGYLRIYDCGTLRMVWYKGK